MSHLVQLWPDEGFDGLGVCLWTNDEHFVAYLKDGVTVGDADLAVVQDA